jgi:hypothetical protein
MRIDSLHPDTELVLTIGKTEKRVATFIGIQGVKTDRIAMFASSDDDGLYRWSAYRVGGYWRTGPLAESVKIDSIVRDPRFPEPEPKTLTYVEYGYQPNNSEGIVWTESLVDAQEFISRLEGRVVYRTITVGETLPLN